MSAFTPNSPLMLRNLALTLEELNDSDGTA